MIILLHTSKTMRPPIDSSDAAESPQLLPRARELIAQIQLLSPEQLEKIINVSSKLAHTTHELLQHWTDDPSQQRPAIDSFLGDIYSGLQVQTWSQEDRTYADKHLRILSGLYGALKPLDGIYPYRFEMGYRLPNTPYKTMYDFWGEDIAATLPKNELIVNLAAVEYSKVVTNYIDEKLFITPKFLTISQKTKQPEFVVVHAKIARGAFARWMIQNRVEASENLKMFADLGYAYDAALSLEREPVFVCEKFGGLGLSVRLS